MADAIQGAERGIRFPDQRVQNGKTLFHATVMMKKYSPLLINDMLTVRNDR